MLNRICTVASLLAVAGLCAVATPNADQGGPSPQEQARIDQQNTALRALLLPTVKLPLIPGAIAVQPPATADWATGMVSWVAASRDGLTYLLQRGDKADPIIAVDRNGKIVRSWGKGMYTMPHAIRVDPQGNVWTTDAASSMVYKFKPDGTLLLKIGSWRTTNAMRK